MTRHRLVSWVALLLFGAMWLTAHRETAAQQRGTPQGDVQSWYLQWPLPPGAERYRDIDGRRMHEDVVAQADIARRYRDQVNPKYWGRIIGHSSDAESAEWLARRFRAVGLSEVRIQKFGLIPQWYPRRFHAAIRSGGKTVELVTAQPFYRSPGTPADGLDLEAVYVGFGNAGDFAGRDVRGKAVFIYRMPLGPPDVGARQRAEANGAAVVFDVHMLPGNIKFQAYPGGDVSANPATVPTFSLGGDDGSTVHDMIQAAPSGQPVRVSVSLVTEMIPNLETALVWGTLPGATDETIYVIAHRDGWFDSGSDNASGVATMIGLAEHYARLPQAERRRTMIFIGTDGHHNSGPGSGPGLAWMGDPANRATLFSKTALFVNAEHTSAVQTSVRPRYIRGGNPNQIFWTNTHIGQQWYAGGSSRPALQQLAAQAFREFGVTTYFDPNPAPPAGECGRFSTFVPCLATSEFYHYFQTDHETPETVPWTGLEATTRAYARIIDGVNQMALSDLKRPEESPARGRR
jgi:hypothetical protein